MSTKDSLVDYIRKNGIERIIMEQGKDVNSPVNEFLAYYLAKNPDRMMPPLCQLVLGDADEIGQLASHALDSEMPLLSELDQYKLDTAALLFGCVMAINTFRREAGIDSILSLMEKGKDK